MDDDDELLAQISSALREKGARMTGPRDAVVRVLLQHRDHLTAEQIHERVADLDDGIHFTSVHRTLDMLRELGVVQEVQVGRGAALYHLVHDDPPHAHVQCRGCGSMVDLPSDVLEPVARKLFELTGFELDAHGVALSGRCRECRLAGKGQ